MKRSKTKRNKIVLLTAIVVVVALGVWYALTSGSSGKTTKTATKEAKSAAEVKQSDTLQKPTEAKNASGDSVVTSSSANQSLSITVSRPVNGDTLPVSETLEIRSVISGATSGTCNLSASGPSGKTVTKSVSIAAQPSYGSCSIDIASSQLSAGEWQISLVATSGSQTGNVNFKVTLQ